MKTITLKNLKNVKLSDLVESVVYDIERMERFGFQINMANWFNNCGVCLGTAAACGFLPAKVIKKMKHKGYCASDIVEIVNNKHEKEVGNMIQLFNSLREGHMFNVSCYFFNMSGTSISYATLVVAAFNAKLKRYYSTVEGKELKQLKTQLLAFSNELRKMKY